MGSALIRLMAWIVTKWRYQNMGMRRSWRVAAGCNPVPEKVNRFDSYHAHQNNAAFVYTGIRILAFQA